MRILFVTPYVPSSVRVRPYGLIRGLAQRGHQVSLVCLVQPRWEAEYLEEVRPYCHSVYPVMISRAESFKNLLFALPTATPLSVAYCQSTEFKSQVRQLVGSRSFDLLHTEFIRAAPATAALNGLPKVYDAVDSLGLAYQRSLSGNHISAGQRMVSKLEALKMPAYEAQALRYYDRSLVSSPVDQQFIAKRDGSRIPDVLPNGVDLDYFAFCEAEREPERVLFVGKMSYYANVSSILWFYEEVLPLVRKVIPSVRVDIVGRNPNAKIKALGRDPMVEVTGAVADVRPYLHRATVAICPMMSGSGIQNKMLEAMAAGTAVVATPIAAQAIPVKVGEHLLVGENAGQFADHVIKLIFNPSLRGELAIRARAYVEDHHNWRVITQQLEGAYMELLSIKETKHG